MAQQGGRRATRIRLLARRYGIAGGKGVALACVVLVVLLGVVGYARLSQAPATVVERASTEESPDGQGQDGQGHPANESNDEEQGSANKEVWVHVDGAVAKPGVYAVEGGAPRINDAVQLAGGLTSDADTSTLNLAASLEDGQKVHVPRVGEEPQVTQASSGAVAQSASGMGGAGAEGSGGGININTASEAELQELPGVGEATAAAIVEERNSGGPFASPEDIMRVSGIGEKKFAKMKERICV